MIPTITEAPEPGREQCVVALAPLFLRTGLVSENGRLLGVGVIDKLSSKRERRLQRTERIDTKTPRSWKERLGRGECCLRLKRNHRRLVSVEVGAKRTQDPEGKTDDSGRLWGCLDNGPQCKDAALVEGWVPVQEDQ